MAEVRRLLLFVVGSMLACAIPASAQTHGNDPLIVLRDTGAKRGGLPVFERHPDAAFHAAALRKGYSGRLLRLYPEVLALAGRPAEPAYLCLTSNQGGFPRKGFYFDGQARPETWYVDLMEDRMVHGRYGATDQIFPHELFHVIHCMLAGDWKPRGSNQVHAIGVRTDSAVALSEGMAEHCQILAIGDPEADPATRALSTDQDARRRAYADMDAYSRELGTAPSVFWRWRITFPLWFSNAEQALRYWAVKENAYAFDSPLPARLAARGDRYAAYLAENVLPGSAGGARKSLPRLMATESVVAHISWRLATMSALESSHRKLFCVLHEKRPHGLGALLMGWKQTFPEDAARIEAIEREALGGPAQESPVEIWLRNDAFVTGTTLFDQFRALPRAHTFDLNGATRNELLGVSGMNEETAAAILAALPLARVEDLSGVRGVTTQLMSRLAAMASAPAPDSAEEGIDDALRPILISLALRLLAALLGCAVAGACLYRLMRPARWYRLALNGLAVALVALPLAWLPGLPPWMAVAAPFVLWALPGAALNLRRHRSYAEAARVILAWAAAAVPVGVVSWPWA